MKSKSINKDYREEIRLRFLDAVRQVIASRVKGVTNITQLAPMIGVLQQNLSKMEKDAQTGKGGRYPTLEQVARFCEIFSYSTEWIMLGKKDSSAVDTKVEVHEDRLNRIELIIEKILKTKQRK